MILDFYSAWRRQDKVSGLVGACDLKILRNRALSRSSEIFRDYMKRAVLNLFVLLTCAICGFNRGNAQAVKIAEPACQQLKENTLLFSIVYERAEQKRGKTKDIVLRLRNNSTCDAAFLADIDHSIRLARQPDGRM